MLFLLLIAYNTKSTLNGMVHFFFPFLSLNVIQVSRLAISEKTSTVRRQVLRPARGICKSKTKLPDSSGAKNAASHVRLFMAMTLILSCPCYRGVLLSELINFNTSVSLTALMSPRETHPTAR